MFVKSGIWALGWEESDKPPMWNKALSIQRSDRIAIKRRPGGRTPLGQDPGLRILHLGVVRELLHPTNELEISKVICTVDWVAVDLNRHIACGRGALGAIHGPYQQHESWIPEVFCL